LKTILQRFYTLFDDFWNSIRIDMRTKLLLLFLLVKVIPLIILAIIAWRQCVLLGDLLQDIAVTDSSAALNSSAVENIERMTTDAALEVAEFLYERDADILYLATLAPSADSYRHFGQEAVGRLLEKREWTLSPDDSGWRSPAVPAPSSGGVSTNPENDDMDGFHYRAPDLFRSETVPLYDEITFVGLDGQELYKFTAPDSRKTNYPMSPELRNVADRANTYVKAETYFPELQKLKPGEIYVSDVIGAYVGTNYIGMYTQSNVADAAESRGYPITYDPEAQAYAGRENPNGQRFEGIVRWATPVISAEGETIGYVTMALNHDHIMEFVDHITPMNERYVEIPSAYEGNYAFIWDYQCRSIAHPRHHSIVGFDPESGEPQIPWLETSIYDAWQASGITPWTDFITSVPEFDAQSREKKPAAALTQAGLVGLDGRYLNNAPQCTGWMNLTEDGGSGSFYILWSGLYKLTTASAIPYYTGQYAPTEQNGFSRRGFGFVAIGAGLEDFTSPARETGEKLGTAIKESLQSTFAQLLTTTLIIILLVVLIAIWMASFLTNNINRLISGVSRFRTGQRQYRFRSHIKDEFGALADAFDEMADSIVDSVKTPLVITDMALRIIYMNEYGLSLNKKTLEETVGSSYTVNSIYPIDSPFCPIRALKEGREADVLYLEDEQRYVRGTANYFLGNNGEKIGYIIQTTDVTEMYMYQIELEKAVAAANLANEHKGDFLARMSHEIRTPMNAIIGITTIVQRKLADTEIEADDDHHQPNIKLIQGHLQKIAASSQHLLSLLNDILDISKIEAGKIELFSETLNLDKLRDTVVGIIQPRCEEKNIRFIKEFDSFDTDFVSDPLRLRQVLINLLGNAAKFTPEAGTVTFSVREISREEGRRLIQFQVKDTGIGIDQETMEAIFKPFEQGNSQITRQYGGTGLGLAISHRIVNLLGGEIVVESSPGKGSSFSFQVWLQEAVPEAEQAEAEQALQNLFAHRRALVVDDIEVNRMIVTSLLEETGMQMDEADDGEVAVAMFTDSPIGTYDIIFMDVQMPVMGGYEATTVIRALVREDARTVPIIALTANAFQDDIDKAKDCGMNDHIAKPVEPERLQEVLLRFLS
jgi:signal transduction histidine kinase/CheY-like chemotaxis protein